MLIRFHLSKINETLHCLPPWGRCSRVCQPSLLPACCPPGRPQRVSYPAWSLSHITGNPPSPYSTGFLQSAGGQLLSVKSLNPISSSLDSGTRQAHCPLPRERSSLPGVRGVWKCDAPVPAEGSRLSWQNSRGSAAQQRLPLETGWSPERPSSPSAVALHALLRGTASALEWVEAVWPESQDGK